MQFHVISCHMHNECYMDNIIHTTYRVSWIITSPAYDFHTSFHSCQYIIQAYINIHMQHVILCSSNDTHTIKPCNGHCTYQFITCQYIGVHANMSLHCQVVTHSQSSHVMAICTYKLITCQYIGTHILTLKHVTIS